MSFDFPHFHDAPYTQWEAARSPEGLSWSADFFGGAWLVSSYALAEAVLRDTAHFSAARTGAWVGSASAAEAESPATGKQGQLAFQALFARAMLFVDGAEHRRLRGLMQDFFKASELERLRGFVQARIEARCADIEARYGADEAFDWIAELARPLPSEVMVEFLGLRDVTAAEYADFARWSHDLAAFIGAPVAHAAVWRAALRSLLQLASFFRRVFVQGRVADGALLKALERAFKQGQLESENELIAQAAMLLFAGHETTRHLLGTGVLHMLQQPAAWQALQAEPELAASAVRELLRFEPPVQYTARRVCQETVLGGQKLARNDLVIVSLAQALRDAARFEQPQVLDVARSNGSMLAFGSGPHICIGAALTQLEAELTLAHISRRWPNLRLISHAWDRSSVTYRGLQSLYVARG